MLLILKKTIVFKCRFELLKSVIKLKKALKAQQPEQLVELL